MPRDSHCRWICLVASCTAITILGATIMSSPSPNRNTGDLAEGHNYTDAQTDPLLSADSAGNWRRKAVRKHQKQDMNINCSVVLGATGIKDHPPVRASYAAMDFVASVARAKRFVEVGSRRGDVIECISHYSSHATSIEADKRYCEVLRKRAHESNGRWSSICDIFSGSLTNIPPGEVFFAWVPSDLDVAFLFALRELQSRGAVPKTAKFLLGFDTKVGGEAKLLHALSLVAESVTAIDYDERVSKPEGVYVKLKNRMHGTYHIAQFDTWRLDVARLENIAKAMNVVTKVGKVELNGI